MIWIHASKYDVIADRRWSDDCCFLSEVSLDTHTVQLHELVEARALYRSEWRFPSHADCAVPSMNGNDGNVG